MDRSKKDIEKCRNKLRQWLVQWHARQGEIMGPALTYAEEKDAKALEEAVTKEAT